MNKKIISQNSGNTPINNTDVQFIIFLLEVLVLQFEANKLCKKKSSF